MGIRFHGYLDILDFLGERGCYCCLPGKCEFPAKIRLPGKCALIDNVIILTSVEFSKNDTLLKILANEHMKHCHLPMNM